MSSLKRSRSPCTRGPPRRARRAGAARSRSNSARAADDRATEIADAIEKDKQTLQPPGKARIGKVMASLPAFVLDALSERGFERT